jgi:soluble lytic murein transglycosylase-like protein
MQVFGVGAVARVAMARFMVTGFELAKVFAAGFVMAVGYAGTAAAQVLDVAPDGAVSTWNGPGVYSDPGAAPEPIAPGPMETPLAARTNIGDQVRIVAERNGISSKVVAAVAWRESRFNPQAVSPKGAVGVMQLMPATARALGVDPRDASANLEGGAAYLAQLLRAFNGDLTLALAAYNAGPDAVRQYAGVPPFPETKAFVDAILNRLADTVAVRTGQ